MVKLYFPLKSRSDIASLEVGQEVLLNGTIYTARDRAHLQVKEMLERGFSFPEFLKESCVFYAGPAFYPDGRLSAIGPTTSERMDAFAPLFYSMGVAATIGKGPRRKSVATACKKYRSIYLVSFGGAAAYLTRFVKSIEVVMFEELGPEAIYKLKVEDFPCVVGIDASGRSLENLLIED